MYLLAPFILQKFKKILELIQSRFRVMKMCHFWAQNDTFVLNKFFWYKPSLLLSSTYWPFSLSKILKNFASGSRVMRMCKFWTQNNPFPRIRFFSENLSMSLVSFIHANLHAKNQSRILIY